MAPARLNYFEPSVARAREYREAMDLALWSDVREALAGSSQASASSKPAGHGSGVVEPASFLDYGAYFDLRLTPPELSEVPAEAKAAATGRLLGRLTTLADQEPRAAPPRITNFSADFFSDDEIARMVRWWDMEAVNRMGMTGLSGEQFARSGGIIAIAMAHLRDAAPEIHGEVELIVRDIVLSRSDGKTSVVNYGGASSLALWGAMTVNPEAQPEWPLLYRQIVHEAGHNLLFAIAREEALVEDDPADRKSSPVRPDPRPTDGIFHAAFVSAREALALDALLCRHAKAGCLTESEAERVADMLELSVLAFWDCAEILRGEARLTKLGDAVLADCESAMNANFAVEPF